jgi:hypothetical protein
LTSFVIAALEEKLRRVLAQPLTFEQAFKREYPQLVLVSKVKVECYGGFWITPKEGEPWRAPTAHFTLANLREHYESSRWDEETYGLIEEQLRLHKAAGHQAAPRLLVPPMPTVARVRSCPRTGQACECPRQCDAQQDCDLIRQGRESVGRAGCVWTGGPKCEHYAACYAAGMCQHPEFLAREAHRNASHEPGDEDPPLE